MVTLWALVAVAWGENPTWSQSGMIVPHRIVLPADVLPEGRAVVELDHDEQLGLKHTVAVDVVAGQAATVRLWGPSYVPFDEDLHVIARSDRGEEYRQAFVPDDATWDTSPRVIGPPGALGEVVGTLHDVIFPVDTALQLAGPDSPCRELIWASYVIGEGRPELWDCAGRGGTFVLVGEAPAGVGEDLVPWGPGWVAAVEDFASASGPVIEAAQRQYNGMGASHYDPLDTTATPPDARLLAIFVLAVLISYVFIIGPVGYIVGIRPRRMLVAWGWFPAVALTAGAVSLVVGIALRPDPKVEHLRTEWTSPQGTGIAWSTLRTNLRYGRTAAVSLPWRDADVSTWSQGHRFGSPFVRPSGPMQAREADGKLTVQIRATSYYAPAFGWAEPIEVPVLPLARRGDRWEVSNPTPDPVIEGLLLVDQRAARFGAIAPGAAVTLTLDEVDYEWDDDYDWLDGATHHFLRIHEGLQGSEVFALVVLLDAAPEGLSVAPDLPLEHTVRRIISGPLPSVPVIEPGTQP